MVLNRTPYVSEDHHMLAVSLVAVKVGVANLHPQVIECHVLHLGGFELWEVTGLCPLACGPVKS